MQREINSPEVSVSSLGGDDMGRITLFIFILISGILFIPSLSFSAEKISTKVVIRVVSKDAKVIGSGVGGASVRIVDLETGATLAEGKQEGGTGDTERIMIQPRRRGETVYGTPGAAFFQADLNLDRPTQVGIYVEAPLAYPQAMQKGLKTLTLIPGKHILGEGVVIELDGLIVNLVNPKPGEKLIKSTEVKVAAEVKML